MQNWQSISGAPKDGTRILSFAPEGVNQIEIASWKTNRDPDVDIEGTWRDDGATPTLWMPLPIDARVR